MVLVSRDQSLKKVRVKADARWTLAQLERETLAFLVQQNVIADTALPFVFLQSEAGEYMLCKEDLVGDWFVTGDAFRFAPPPGQGLSLFVSAGQFPLELQQQPISSPVRPHPPTYSSGKKVTNGSIEHPGSVKGKRQGGASLAHLLNDLETESAKKTPPPRGSEQRCRSPPQEAAPRRWRLSSSSQALQALRQGSCFHGPFPQGGRGRCPVVPRMLLQRLRRRDRVFSFEKGLKRAPKKPNKK